MDGCRVAVLFTFMSAFRGRVDIVYKGYCGALVGSMIGIQYVRVIWVHIYVMLLCQRLHSSYE